MKFRIGAYAATALLVLAAGCASQQACQVIPKQLELARFERDQVKAMVDAKQADVARYQDSMELAKTRLSQMEQEKADLEKTLAQQKADSIAAAGRKKR
jgi:hypothetical protein